jgi:hypothetical protein
MNEDDLRDCFAMFIVNGIVSRGITGHTDLNEVAENAYTLADKMIEARSKTPDIGITAVKPKRRSKDEEVN